MNEYFSDSVFSSSPTSVNKPDVNAMIVNLLEEKVSINLRLERKEGLSEA